MGFSGVVEKDGAPREAPCRPDCHTLKHPLGDRTADSVRPAGVPNVGERPAGALRRADWAHDK